MLPLETSVSGIVWPPLSAPEASEVLALQFQMELAQWWPEATVHALQQRQLAALLGHHGVTPAVWNQLPAWRGSPKFANISPNHPALTAALLLRHRGWWRCRAAAPTIYLGIAPNALGDSGRALETCADLLEQLRHVAQPPRAHLRTTPAFALELARSRQPGLDRGLRVSPELGAVYSVETFGRPISRAERTLITTGLGAPVLETLFIEGLGPIAHRCPEHFSWHLAAEGYLAGPADGHLTMSALHSFDVPVLRVVAPLTRARTSCPCGRGLPNLVPT